MGKDIIKVIVGQRRTGKSYFLFQLMDLIRQNHAQTEIIYINKEDLRFDHIKDYNQLVEFAEKSRKSEKLHAIFIDEIQDIEHFEKALRHLQASGKWDIYCTGSNANLLSGELSTYLSGRYIEIKMYGLSYPEFLQFHALEENAVSFAQYIKYGGLPYLIHLELKEEIVFDYLKNVYTTILYKDIISRFNIRNTSFLERLVAFVADNIGQIFSAKNISDYLKSQKLQFSNNIVLDYLGYLQQAFLIFSIRRNDLKGKRILETGEKYYFHDLGLRHAIISYKSADISQLLENIVLLHLYIQGYSVTVGKFDDKEIDFIAVRNSEKIYLQVTLSLADEKVRIREYGNLLAVGDNYRKLVVTADEYTNEEFLGIETINIRKFLTQ